MIAQMDSLYVRTRPSKVLSRVLSYAFFEGRPLTTRGRWINPLVFALFRVASTAPALRRVEKPIFILGTGRSGTTVLGLVLSTHPHVGFLNEPKALWHAIHPEEDVIGSYSLGHARYRLKAEDAGAAIRNKAKRLFGAYLASTFSRRVVDKYPELIFRVPFVRAIFPDALFLFLVRNGWETCQSINQWSEKFGGLHKGETCDWWGLGNRKWKFLVEQVVRAEPDLGSIIHEVRGLKRQSDMAAVEWIVTMREGLRLMKEFPNCAMMVRYEEMASHPDRVLRELLDFCLLPSDDRFLEYGRKKLRPTSPRRPIELHPAILPFFAQTQHDLGYRV